MNQTLYEVSAPMELIITQLEEMQLTEAQIQEAIDDFLEGEEEFLRQKLDDYCKVIVNADADAKAKREEAHALCLMAQVSERTRDTLKERCKLFFERAGIKKYPTEHFALQPMKIADEVIQDPTLLPKHFQKIVPDNEAIRLALESGLEVKPAGTQEFFRAAWLEERGTHFRVR